MKVGFVLNRAMRKTLRLTTQRHVYNTAHTDLTETLRRDACLTDDVLLQNLEFLDRDYDHDEFMDIDNEYEERCRTYESGCISCAFWRFRDVHGRFVYNEDEMRSFYNGG